MLSLIQARNEGEMEAVHSVRDCSLGWMSMRTRVFLDLLKRQNLLMFLQLSSKENGDSNLTPIRYTAWMVGRLRQPSSAPRKTSGQHDGLPSEGTPVLEIWSEFGKLLVQEDLWPRVMVTNFNLEKSNMVWDARIVRNELAELMRCNGVSGILVNADMDDEGIIQVSLDNWVQHWIL